MAEHSAGGQGGPDTRGDSRDARGDREHVCSGERGCGEYDPCGCDGLQWRGVRFGDFGADERSSGVVYVSRAQVLLCREQRERQQQRDEREHPVGSCSRDAGLHCVVRCLLSDSGGCVRTQGR